MPLTGPARHRATRPQAEGWVIDLRCRPVTFVDGYANTTNLLDPAAAERRGNVASMTNRTPAVMTIHPGTSLRCGGQREPRVVALSYWLMTARSRASPAIDKNVVVLDQGPAEFR